MSRSGGATSRVGVPGRGEHADAAVPTPAPTRRGRPPSVFATVLPVAVISLLVNVGLRLGAGAAGVGFVVRPPSGAPLAIDVGPVAAVSVLPLLVAGVALALTRRWAPRSWRVLAWAGLVVGVVSLPLFVDAPWATRAVLSLMHLVPAALWFAAVRRAAGRGSRGMLAP